MINIFLYSIAGKKTNDAVDILIQELCDSKYTPKKDKNVLKHTLQVSKNGNYPSQEYYSTFYNQPEVIYSTLGEIKTLQQNLVNYYTKLALDKELVEAINESDDVSNLLNRISNIPTKFDKTTTSKLDEATPVFYTRELNKEHKGIMTGVKEIDAETYGFQPGTVVSICAFTGSGKSSFVNSILFKNILEGKKCCLFSLEIAPPLVWNQFQARYANQVKGLAVTSKDLVSHKIPKDIEDKVIETKEDFKKDITKNLLILDESYISKEIMCNYKLFTSLMKEVENKLGGLDIVAFDHVGQFELMFQDLGNVIIKNIQSFTKTYKNNNNQGIVSLMAVQTNRQGEMRARKRNGVYDIQAISDLNECGLKGTTILTSNPKIDSYGKLKNAKVLPTVNCYDYKTNLMLNTSIKEVFNTGYVEKGELLYTLSYDGCKNQVFTTNHRVLVDGVKTKLSDLPDVFLADKVELVMSEESKQILKVALLTGGTLRNRGKEKYPRIKLVSRDKSVLEYKRVLLGDYACKVVADSDSYHMYTKPLKNFSEILNLRLNDFGLEVLEDECRVRGLLTRVLVKSSLQIIKQAFQDYKTTITRASSKTIVTIYRDKKLTRHFVSSHVLSPSFIDRYKSKYQLIRKGVVVNKTPLINYKRRELYNFEVVHTSHNYILPGGLISANCERTSSYVIFLYTSDDMKVMQETKMTLAKHRLGAPITEPIVTSFNPGVITVGSSVEEVTVSESDFNDMALDFGGGFEEF